MVQELLSMEEYKRLAVLNLIAFTLLVRNVSPFFKSALNIVKANRERTSKILRLISIVPHQDPLTLRSQQAL